MTRPVNEDFKDEHARHVDAVLREPDPAKELEAREHIEAVGSASGG